MSEYLYVAVNRSMPGLVKVGYTTREPRDRLRELHTTGVPTPFDHVAVLIVGDGAAAEREAHKALDEFRMDRNREFFTVQPVVAVRRILKVVENYEIDWDNTTNLDEISELDRRNKLYLAEKDRKEKERLADRESENQERIASEITDLGRKISELDSEIASLQRERSRLGQDPGVRHFRELRNVLRNVLGYCLLPVFPGGWFWACIAFSVFDHAKHPWDNGTWSDGIHGLIGLSLIAAGWYWARPVDEKHEARRAPFLRMDRSLSEATALRAKFLARKTELTPKEAADIELRERITKLQTKIQQFDKAISRSERDRELMGPRPRPGTLKNASKVLWFLAMGVVIPAVFIGATYGWRGVLCLLLPAGIAGVWWWKHCANHNKKLQSKYIELIAPFNDIDKLIVDGKAWRAKLIAEKTQLEVKR